MLLAPVLVALREWWSMRRDLADRRGRAAGLAFALAVCCGRASAPMPLVAQPIAAAAHDDAGAAAGPRPEERPPDDLCVRRISSDMVLVPPKARGSAAFDRAAAIGALMATMVCAPSMCPAVGDRSFSSRPNGHGFDRDAAVAVLSAVGSSLGACRAVDGPSGVGRVAVLFEPSGAAVRAQVQYPPFRGTPRASCVASKFLGVRIPPFDGDPIVVCKPFSIE
jgi:hypothetical protein